MEVKKSNKILLFIKTPPPVTGATLMNQLVYNSKTIHENFDVRALRISYAKSIEALGDYSIKKILKVINVFFSLLYELFFHRPRFVYFQVSPLGVTFYRDLIFISFIKLFRVKILYHLHGKGIKNACKSKWVKQLYKFAFKDESAICLSHLLTDDIKDVYHGQIYIVNNGIPDMNEKHTVKFSTNGTPLKILFLSNLIKSKGVLDYLDALAIMASDKLPFEGVIVGGEGDLTAEMLEIEIEMRNLKNLVKYVGPKYKDDKNGIIANSDLLIFPTKNDVWGNVILEAMQFYKPVIATTEGAIPEIINDGVTGFLVDKSAPEQIAQKIQLLIKKPELRRLMGVASRNAFEEKYTLVHFEKNLLSVFKKIIEQET
jgi:glycosyltransferase involved in cell wall biosynthesis